MTGATAVDPQLGWNLVSDVRQLFAFPFMVNAFRAGTIAAITSSLVGWFMVLRRQTFAGHTLALVGFPGAAGAVLIGVSAQLGFFTFCIAGALAIALAPGAGSGTRPHDSAVIGLLQAGALAAGFLFASLYGGNLHGVTALLFGNPLTVSRDAVLALAVIALVTLAALVALARPLLFASIDPDVAAARGVPVRAVTVAFTLVLGIGAAASSEITGSLLVFTLLVLPATTAQVVTARPALSAGLAVGLALVVTWAGLAAAYYSPYPLGFWISSFAFSAFLAARLVAAMRLWSNARLAA